jgi:hypothetical protein
MSEIIKGFKVFNPDWTCSPNGNTKQYTCPGKFEEDVTPIRCGQGMHFCKVAADCFNYYSFNPDNHVAEVAAYGEVVEEGDKCATNKLEIIREIPWAELLEMVNTGKGCAGLCNSGDCNSGDWNSGNRNSGDCNSGNRNSGNRNSGDCNSGNRNSGNRNSGDWNNTNFSNGCFNTVEPTIHLFNKPSSWTYRDWLNSEARYLMNQIQGDILEWVYLSDMTDEEKAEHPEAETTGGYLKELDNSECAVIWWRSLNQRQKNVIMAIPNFDKAIFKEITGIDVDAD